MALAVGETVIWTTPPGLSLLNHLIELHVQGCTPSNDSLADGSRWHRELSATFGWRFIGYIGFAMHLIKGILAGGGSSGLCSCHGGVTAVSPHPALPRPALLDRALHILTSTTAVHQPDHVNHHLHVASLERVEGAGLVRVC